MAVENKSKERLKKIIRKELVPKLKILAPSLTEECIEYIILNSRLTPVAKDEFIQKNGSYEDSHLSFLYSGLAFGFHYDQRTEKIFATRLWKKNEIIFDTNSFVNRKDRIEDIQMLEDGELIFIDYYSLQALLHKFPEVFSLLLNLAIKSEEHSRFYQNLLISTFKERVILFLQRYPTLVDRISKDAIALYLNMPRSSFNHTYELYKGNKGELV